MKRNDRPAGGDEDDETTDDATTESRPTARPTSNDGLTTIGFFHEFARVVSRARS